MVPVAYDPSRFFLSRPHQRMRSRFEHLRAVAYQQVNPEAREGGLSAINHLLILAVLIAVGVQILETEPLLSGPYKAWFQAADALVGLWFSVDLILRVWAMGEEPRFGGVAGRLRYLSKPRVLMDVLAVLPFIAWPWIGFLDANDLAFLRLVTAVSILMDARLGRLSVALRALRLAMRSRKEELILSLMIGVAVMLVTATGLFLVEGAIQPEAFGSIPRALWWSLETLTTVGYGDVLPQTVLGKILAGTSALVGIGIIAIPTGIVAAAFGEAFQVEKSVHVPSSSRED